MSIITLLSNYDRASNYIILYIYKYTVLQYFTMSADIIWDFMLSCCHWSDSFRDKRKGSLSIDGGVPVSKVANQGATQLDTDGYLWLGRSSCGSPYVIHETLVTLLKMSFEFILEVNKPIPPFGDNPLNKLLWLQLYSALEDYVFY